MQDFYPSVCFYLALALRESGKTEAAKKIAAEGIDELLKEVGDTWEAAWIPLMIAKLEIASGKVDRVAEYVNQANALGGNDQGAQVYLAEVYALSGKSNEAIGTLKQVLESGYPDPYFIQIFPAFYSLQTDPDFRALFHFK
jgi:tetratricopeptide (TPR) repeat protein